MTIIEGQANQEVLACLTAVDKDVTIQLPDELLAEQQDVATVTTIAGKQIQTSKKTIPITEKIHLSLSPPTLDDNRGDLERLKDAIREQLSINIDNIHIALEALKTLPAILRGGEWSPTATVALERDKAFILAVESGDTTQDQVVMAVDIGTTSIAAQLLNPFTGAILANTNLLNSQAIFGSDVTSRVIAAEKRGVTYLQEAIIRDLNTAVASLCQATGIERTQIHTIVCAGNTIMCHFLLGLDSSHIRRFPYIAAATAPNPIKAAEIGIAIHPQGRLHCLPGIGSWIGGDITAGIYASGIQSTGDLSLLMDIGTNGEIVIGNHQWLMTCSASAGPALEGAGVECGMRAIDGAIEKVDIEQGTLTYKTIGDSKPKGICGSGIIDLVASMLKAGIIDRGGKFTAAGKRRHTLVKADATAHGRDIAISEGDIENIISAKGALYAAMTILLKRLDLDVSAIRRFFIAGAFGGHIDIENAVTIGLLPNLPRDIFHFAGNTSLAGACSAALDRDAYESLGKIAADTTYYDLMAAEDYVEEFSKALFLPHTDIHRFHNPNGRTS
jgi:uncharacterized 2Fe-2S/4Fe-4S cluster protein (DUF4445 family)